MIQKLHQKRKISFVCDYPLDLRRETIDRTRVIKRVPSHDAYGFGHIPHRLSLTCTLYPGIPPETIKQSKPLTSDIDNYRAELQTHIYTNGNSLSDIYINVHRHIYTAVVERVGCSDVVAVMSREYGGALSTLPPKFFITSKKVEYWTLPPRVS